MVSSRSVSLTRAFLAVAALVFCATAGVAAQGAQAPTQAAQSQPVDGVPGLHYVIGPQDVLVITLWDQAEVPAKFTVEADGSFTFPYIGRIQAAGLSLRQFEADIKKRLTDGGFFKNPQVSVAVEQYRSQRIFVVGEVRTPGAYTLTGEMTLIEALARAGSTTVAAADEAVIVRPKAGTQQTGPLMPGEQADASEIIKVDIKELQGGALGNNVALRDGDTLFVPRAESIYVFGQVRNPGAYPLQGKNTTVLQALSLAGGVTDRGSTNRIQIVRIVNGEKKELKAKLTDPVNPGDTIIVKERFF
jgi:polysaccharide export outer membrane protein